MMLSQRLKQEESVDYELVLYDRIHIIKDTIEKYGENNFYISFSGGRDSTILSHLIDMALPNNQIPRVFINTGIEYTSIMQFVKKKSEMDERIVIYNSNVNIPKMLKKYGYPFKSKEHSNHLATFQKSGMTKMVIKYLGVNKMVRCPNVLRYQFESGLPFKVSDECCHQLKKRTIKRYQKESSRKIAITGMLREEGGQRMKIDCILTDKNGNLVKFHPFAKVSNNFLEWLRERA